MKFQKYKQLTPILILTGFCLWTAYYLIFGSVQFNGLTISYLITPKQYIAFTVLAINYAAFFLFRKSYKYVLAVTLLAGFFDLITFTPMDSKINLDLNNLHLELQPSVLLVAFVTVMLNLDRIGTLLEKREKAASVRNRNYEEIEFKNEMEKFRTIYRNYSTDELSKILADKRFKKSALAAAWEIVNEREQKLKQGQ